MNTVLFSPNLFPYKIGVNILELILVERDV